MPEIRDFLRSFLLRAVAQVRRHPVLLATPIILLPFLVGLSLSAWWTCGYAGCPDPDSLSVYQPDGASLLLDRDGEPLAELAPRPGEVVALDDLPSLVREAFVAVEDRRFREHDGVDWIRLAGAALVNLKEGGLAEGGSTITMQLARNMFSERIPANERTFRRKIVEMRVARAIEERFTKEEILELYLNHIYFGGGTHGIEAASRHWFGHGAAELSVPKMALLAALPKAPSHYDPREHPEAARERRDLVLRLMVEQGRLGAQEAEAAAEAPLGVTASPPPRPRDRPGDAPYFAEAVRRQLEERFGPSI
jgi:penicillin-binding protein 1A